PLPFLDHFGVGLLDESSHSRKHLAPPVTELLDSRIDQRRGRASSFSFLRAALQGRRFLHGYRHSLSLPSRPSMSNQLITSLSVSASAPGPQRISATRTWRPGRPAADPAGSPTAPCAGGSPCSSG